MNRGVPSSLQLARDEWRKERRELLVHSTVVSVIVISLLLFILFASLHYFGVTGYATSLSSGAGTISEVDIQASLPVEIWGGIYGLVLRVDGFTQQLSEDLDSGTVVRSDLFFNCIDQGATGGPEFYASTNNALDLATATVTPATAAMIDAFIGCSGQEYCANETFTQNMSFYLGETLISEVPAVYTYKYTGEQTIFDVGALNVSGSLVFVAHINTSIQPGYNPDALVNYQMLLPTPANTTQTYYFYNDPSDSCPPGGLGTTINASVYGTVVDSEGAPVSGALVTVAGYSATTNASGFYNLSTLLLEGTFSAVVQADGYDPYIGNVTISFAETSANFDAVLVPETPSTGGALTVSIRGYVNDTAGDPLNNVTVSFGDGNTTTNSSGVYNMTVSVAAGTSPIIGIKSDYDNYVGYVSVSAGTSVINYNFTMGPANLNQFLTGPFTQQLSSNDNGDGEYDEPPSAEQTNQETALTEPAELSVVVPEGAFRDYTIHIHNYQSSAASVTLTLSSDIEPIVELDKTSFSIPAATSEKVIVTVYGTLPVGIYRGVIDVSGGLDVEVPARIEIIPRKLPIATLDLTLDLFNTVVRPGGNLRYRLIMNNLLSEQGYRVALKHLVTNPSGVQVLLEESEEVEVDKSLTLLEEIEFPDDFEEGEYLLNVEASYLGLFSSVTSPFVVARPLYLYSFFGIPLWLLFVIISMAGFVFLNFLLYKRHQNKKKRYHLELHTELLPKAGDRAIKLGHLAERKEAAYYNIDDLTTHMIVAGATGGGKSIAAQVFVEEMLKKNISVIVFDPTAQWSGMLRKCDDKKMMSFYPKFGLKPSDARGFPGSVRQVTNHLQSIDINKYLQPGQIQIFTLNKLDPAQIDTFVAGVINNVFKSDPKEHPGLKTVLVFDEVHRLLPKFGGSGKGFLQIERACREFRKWGLGVMLVSQVLSDFVGEIKANINTELQMRVAEEKDLERIRERYGADSLKSLVRADIGTGMVQNAEYNRGLPYFVTLRPILHSTRRLSDEVLEKYNSYNSKIEDLEYQVSQLEAEKIDVFDLKMELKLVKDKLMTGNFTVVDIYLEGLGPRLQKQWDALGKKPKAREVALLDESELEAALKSAQKDRAKIKDKEGGAEEGKPAAKVDPAAKIVAPLTLDNGAMISSLNELKDVLPGLDDAVFKVHVNDKKNDVAKWVGEQVDKALGEKMQGVTDKAKLVEIAKGFGAKDEVSSPKDSPSQGEKSESDSEEKPAEGKVEKKESDSGKEEKGESKEKASEEKSKDDSSTEEKKEESSEEKPAEEKVEKKESDSGKEKSEGKKEGEPKKEEVSSPKDSPSQQGEKGEDKSESESKEPVKNEGESKEPEKSSS